MIVTNGPIAPILRNLARCLPNLVVSEKEGRMMCTRIRPRGFSLCVRFAFVPFCAGIILVGYASPIVAQTVIARPPSRVLEDGRIDPQAKPVWTLPAPEISPPAKEPPTLGLVEPISHEVLESPEFLPPPEPHQPEPHFPAPGRALPFLRIVPCLNECRDIPYVPNMLGDFFGVTNDSLTVRGNQLLNAAPGATFDPAALGSGPGSRFFLASPGSSLVGRQKAANNNSPLPRDRVFLNFDEAFNTSLQDGGANVRRLMPGLERTFWGGNMSWSVRVPMAWTLNSKAPLTGRSGDGHAELGNVTLGLKGVLFATRGLLFSGGMMLTVPTASDLRYFNSSGRELIRVQNQSVHIMPYLAGLWSDGGFFVQGFLQWDFDANGNPVQIDNGTRLAKAGMFQDANFLYFDVGAGYWLFKNRTGGCITGIAPTMELHYNNSINNSDAVLSASGFRYGSQLQSIETVNALWGATLQLGPTRTLSLGYAAPLGGGNDEQFDSQFLVQFNCFFGGNSQPGSFLNSQPAGFRF